MTDETPSQGLLVLERIASGHPDVLLAMQECFPSPYEIDMCDEDALRRLLEAIVAAARAPIASIPEPDMRGDVVERVARALRDESDRQLNERTTIPYPPAQIETFMLHAKAAIAAIDAACPRHE